ncbi:MAG: VOC family protein [Acidimicrobiia bacterium]
MKISSYEEGRSNWTDLSSTDPEASKAFYSALFGWKWDTQPADENGVEYHMAVIGDAPIAGLMQQPQDQADMGVPPMWNTYLAVEDCDDCTKRAEEAGGKVVVEPMDVMDAGRMSFVMDPTGAAVGLWEKNEFAGAAIIDEPNAYTWSELITNDIERATPFYSKAVGLDTETVEMGGPPYTTFKVGDTVVGGTMNPPMEQIPNHWHVYFGAENCDAMCETAKANGGQIVAGPLDTPVGRMATIKDPQGVAFSVIQLNEWPTE